MKNMQQNYTIMTGDIDGVEYKYITTGSDTKVELKAAGTPGYYGPTTKGMPKTGDTSSALVFGMVITAAFAALLSAYSVRQRKTAGK